MNVSMSLCVSPDTDCQGTLSFALRQHPFNLELDNGWMDNYDQKMLHEHSINTSVLLFLLQPSHCIKMLILFISTNHKYNLKFITTLFIFFSVSRL